MVPFSLTTAGPTTPDEINTYDEFNQSIHTQTFSTAVGRVVKQRQVFEEIWQGVHTEFAGRASGGV